MSERYAVIGAGAVGCFYGGMLARSGTRVTLIGRPPHVEAIARDGLRLESRGFDERIRVDAAADPRAASEADVVLLCVKSSDTETAIREAAPYLRAGARVVSLQNGFDNASRAGAALGRPVLAAVVWVGCGMAGPGHVRHTGRGELVLGALREHRAADPALDAAVGAIAARFEAAGIRCTVSTSIEAELWTKLVINCAYNAISALTGAQYGRMAADAAIRSMMSDIIAESVAVARADGVTLDQGALAAQCLRVAEGMPTQISSTAQDVLRGKATEIDALNGYVAARAQAHGLAAPINRTLHALVKLRERSPPA
jgi:2-dehydropantoate 2-reductase